MQQVVDYVTLGIASIAGLVIIYGVILSVVELVAVEWKRLRSGDEKAPAFEKIRYDLGFHLLLGLEFLIAADIVRSVIRPTLEELAILGGIVAIRTVLSYFLGKEIERYK
ncbi:MAG: DUF1622 domain-containing protein [Chloroflexi bacterium]|nr:DUF1622 domain-containing protein [Chloroflexota bacterium]